MEFIIAVLTFIFFAMLIVAILTLGFTLMAAFIGAFAIFYASVLIRRYWRRGWFLYHAKSDFPPAPPPVKKTTQTEKTHITDIEYYE